MKGQTSRVVLNLQDWTGSFVDLKKQFDDYPMDGLEEVIAIKSDGSIINLIP